MAPKNQKLESFLELVRYQRPGALRKPRVLPRVPCGLGQVWAFSSSLGVVEKAGITKNKD